MAAARRTLLTTPIGRVHYRPCWLCFALKDVSSGLWLSAAQKDTCSREALESSWRAATLTSVKAERSVVWLHWYDVGLDVFGTAKEIAIVDSSCAIAQLTSHMGTGCLASNGSSIGWTRCSWGSNDCISDGGTVDCSIYHFGAVPLVVDGTQSTGVSLQAIREQPQYLLRSSSSSIGVALGFLGTDVIEWQAQCIPCLVAPVNLFLVLLLVALFLLALLPTLSLVTSRRRWCHQICSRRVLEAFDRSVQQWPARPVSLQAIMTLQVGFLLAVAGATPYLLWFFGSWWEGSASPYLAISAIGCALVVVAIRVDDGNQRRTILLATTLGLVLNAVLAGTSIYLATQFQISPVVRGVSHPARGTTYIAYGTWCIHFPRAVWTALFTVGPLASSVPLLSIFRMTDGVAATNRCGAAGRADAICCSQPLAWAAWATLLLLPLRLAPQLLPWVRLRLRRC